MLVGGEVMKGNLKRGPPVRRLYQALAYARGRAVVSMLRKPIQQKDSSTTGVSQRVIKNLSNLS